VATSPADERMMLLGQRFVDSDLAETRGLGRKGYWPGLAGPSFGVNA
jgi:hypothetical protein